MNGLGFRHQDSCSYYIPNWHKLCKFEQPTFCDGSLECTACRITCMQHLAIDDD